MKYYSLRTTNPTKGTVAFAPENLKHLHKEIADLDGKNELPFELDLRNAIIKNDTMVFEDDLSGLENIWDDYPANCFAYSMMSERMKDIIDAHLTGHEHIDWISCKVNGLGEKRTYYILRFNKKLDVLNMDKTVFVKGTNLTIKPCFSYEKVKNLSVFTEPRDYDLWKITFIVKVNEHLKKALQKAKLLGVGFEETWVV